MNYCVNCGNLHCSCQTLTRTSLLVATNSSPTTPQAGTNVLVKFDTNIMQNCHTIAHAEGSPDFIITKPGIYFVEYKVGATVPAGGTATTATGYILKDSKQVPISVVTASSIPVGETAILCGSTYIVSNTAPCILSLNLVSNANVQYNGIDFSIQRVN